MFVSVGGNPETGNTNAGWLLVELRKQMVNYDKEEYADELERRRTDTETIDIEEHRPPTDLGTEVPNY
ncbi:hypothetical protein [Halobaculum marinum]|uniref:Uncharacterized protein n=1 Tax=Halobaculum marinum TaxID=3031996 RepID=A0ABD5WRT4_9EURY|nr:hypothetical protein [Halobaculum sp. DT55]